MLYNKTNGFTLTELLIVISVISLLAMGSMVTARQVYLRAQANKIISDFKSIEAAWVAWSADTGQPYPTEDRFMAPSNLPFARRAELAAQQCEDSPPIEVTDIFRNVLTHPSWNGPYMSSIPRDPWGHVYMFDHDAGGGAFDPAPCPDNLGNNRDGGTNVILPVCRGEWANYVRLFDIIDEAIDDSDGEGCGLFRWQETGDPMDPSTFRNRIIFSLSPDD